MASGDTALWLHNKLGSTDDLWSGKSICSQLTVERLQSIQECFHALQPHVKVKLLLSLLHLPRRNIEQWQEDLTIILQMATDDTDPWVCMVGEIMHNFPESGGLNLNLHTSSATFSEILSDLKKTVKKSTEVRMLPLECQYLNKAALTTTAGQIPPLARHFQIKRKPKSATLRAEILQKSTEVANNKKNNVPNSVPIKVRSFAKKMDTTTPMKGIPSRTPPSSSFRTVPGNPNRITSPTVTVTPLGNTWVTNRPGVTRKEGGVKFLDIGEQPVGSREAKKRKRQAEMEVMEQQKKEKEAAAATSNAASSATTSTQSYTPDYAAGLMAPATPKMPTALSTAPTLSVPAPTYVPNSSRIHPTPATTTTLSGVGALSTQQQARKNLQQQLQNSLGQTITVVRTNPTTNVTIAGQTLPVVSAVTTVAPVPMVATTTATTSQPATIIIQAAPRPVQQQQQKLVATQVRLPGILQVQAQAPVTVATQPLQVRLTAQPLVGQTATPQLHSVGGTPAQPAQQKKGLSLTRDQMMEAQEMFRVSNKVSRPEKALILGFMAGSRDNPCPQQGNVLNIKLSENEEMVTQDGIQKKVLVDTYFQMNYGSGEWKRFKKYREIVPS